MDDNRPTPHQHHNLARHLLSGAAWAFIVRCLGVASALAVYALLARMLPPEQLGWYFLLQSIVVFVAIIARFGLKQTVVRMVAGSLARKQPGRARHALKIVYAIVALGALTVGGIYYSFAGEWLAIDVFDTPAIASVVGTTVIWIAILAFQTPVAETFRGLHDIRLATLLDGAFANLLLASSLSVLWLLSVPLVFSNAVNLSAGMVGLSVLCGSVLLAFRIRSLRGAGRTTVREVLSISSPLFVTDIAMQTMTNFSLWIVGTFLAADAVALYGAAWKLVMVVLLPLTLVNMTIQPVIAELYENREKRRLENALRGMATLAGIPAAAVLLVFLFLGSDVLGIIYGAHYRDAALILSVLSVGMLVDVWSGSCGQVLVFTGHQKQFMYIALLSGTISAALAVLGAKFIGVLGVAAAVTVGKVLQNGAAWLLVNRLTGMWTHVTLSPTFIRAAARRLRR